MINKAPYLYRKWRIIKPNIWRHCGFSLQENILERYRANCFLPVCTTGEKSRCSELRNASILFPKSNLQFDLSYDISRAHAIFLKKWGSPKGGRILSGINSPCYSGNKYMKCFCTPGSDRGWFFAMVITNCLL